MQTLFPYLAKNHLVIDSMLYAVVRHCGSLRDIDTIFRALYRIWLPDSDYEPIDSPSFSIHQNLPFQTPEDKLLTDVYLPVGLHQKLY